MRVADLTRRSHLLPQGQSQQCEQLNGENSLSLGLAPELTEFGRLKFLPMKGAYYAAQAHLYSMRYKHTILHEVKVLQAQMRASSMIYDLRQGAYNLELIHNMRPFGKLGPCYIGIEFIATL
jgi:hypothetical protein